MVLRYITSDLPDTRGTGSLPPASSSDLAMRPANGLILMVGATGSGKSTTLAGHDQSPQRDQASDHILTIEDPIEFLHPNKKSIVNQREIGLDTDLYERALRSATARGAGRDHDRRDSRPQDHGGGARLWRAPATWPSRPCTPTTPPKRSTASSTCSRLQQHAQILMDLSQYLRAIVSQRLVKGKTGRRCAADRGAAQHAAHPGADPQGRHCVDQRSDRDSSSRSPACSPSTIRSSSSIVPAA